MQGELYLEVLCQVKKHFFKTFPHINHMLLSLRRLVTTDLMLTLTIFYFSFNSVTYNYDPRLSLKI